MKLSLDWLICVCLNTHSWFLQIKRKNLEHDLPELFCVLLKIHGTQNIAAYVCLRMGAHIWNRPTKLLCFMFDVGAMYHIRTDHGDAHSHLLLSFVYKLLWATKLDFGSICFLIGPIHRSQVYGPWNISVQIIPKVAPLVVCMHVLGCKCVLVCSIWCMMDFGNDKTKWVRLFGNEKNKERVKKATSNNKTIGVE